MKAKPRHLIAVTPTLATATILKEAQALAESAEKRCSETRIKNAKRLSAWERKIGNV